MFRATLFKIILIVPAVLFCQFSRVSISVDAQLLRSSEKQILGPLEQEISRFFTSTEFDQEYNDLGIELQIQLIFEGTSIKGSAQTFMAQTLFSNGTDQRFFDKAVQFVYAPNQSLYYDPVKFESLPSFLAFYASIILAGEIDTYEPTGGTSQYETARTIALRGAASDYSRGWDNRVQLVDDLSSNGPLRRARFHYYYGDELLRDQNPERALEEFQAMLSELDRVFIRSPRERYTLLFLKANAPQLTRDLVILNRIADLEHLSTLDPDNRDLYLGRERPNEP
ncbi:MAG: DUF4835 family protein [FCB group bacterium]|nr:DUF4835 family protein [FCB group bacterium]